MNDINLTNIDRHAASKLNPFIGYSSPNATNEHIQFGLEFLSTAVSALSDGTSGESMCGFSIILDAMSRAMTYEQQTGHPAIDQE